MPQFDPAVWLPQLVWLVITFFALYMLMARVAIPRISDVLEEREHKINDSLRKAELLKEDAEAVIAAYEKTMADARTKAQETLRTVRDRTAAEAAERNAALSERLAVELAAAEARIGAARTEAIKGVREIAIDIATDAASRLAGGAVEKKTVGAAVDAVMKGAK